MPTLDDEPLKLPLHTSHWGVESLLQALLRREKEGGTLGANLVLSGAASARDWLDYCAQKCQLTPVDDDSLEAVDKEAFAALPQELLYDAALLPVLAGEGTIVVALCDPLDKCIMDDVELFAANEVGRLLLSYEQMALHYHRLTGKAWKLDASQLDLRRTADQPTLFAAFDEVMRLDEALNQAHRDELDTVTITLAADDGEQSLILTRSRRTSASTLDQADNPTLTEAERPRIAGQSRGASRHFLAPAEEGEAVLLEQSVGAVVEEPKIIIDMGLLEDEAPIAPIPASSNVIIDMDLLMGKVPLAPPEPPAPAPTPAANAGSSEEDEWARLESDLDSIAFNLADLEGAADDALSFDIDTSDFFSTDLPVVAPPLDEAIQLAWFYPIREPSSGGKVTQELRSALQELRKATDHRALYDALIATVRSVYERAVLLRMDGEYALQVGCDPRQEGHTATADAPPLTPYVFPALVEIIADPGRCFHGHLPKPAAECIHQSIPGDPALTALLCPLSVGGRALMLVYADAGPGRESPRHAELWNLLLRQIPRALLGMLLQRKRRYRWEVKG